MPGAERLPIDGQATDARIADVLVIVAPTIAVPTPAQGADRPSAASTDLAARTAAGVPIPAADQRALARQIAREQGGDPDAAVAQLERIASAATRQAEQELAGDATPVLKRGDVSITKDAQNRTIVRTADGRTIIVDPRAVPTTQGQEQVIQMALVKPPDPPPPSPNDIPPGVIPLVGMVFGCVTAMVLLSPLIRAWIRGRERRAAVVAPAAIPAELGQRLERIEQAVESVAIEVERISEAQRFQTRVLAERLETSPLALPAREVSDVR